VAIGRLPALTAEEANILVAKVARQADVLQQTAGRHLFVADNKARSDADFPALARAAAARLPAGSSASWAVLANSSSKAVKAARTALFRAGARAPR